MTLNGKLISVKNTLRVTEVGFNKPKTIPKMTNSTMDKTEIIFKFTGLDNIRCTENYRVYRFWMK